MTNKFIKTSIVVTLLLSGLFSNFVSGTVKIDALTPHQHYWFDGAIGRGMDPDNAYGRQCVDVILDYGEAIFGVGWRQCVGYGNAKDLFYNTPVAYWEKIANRHGDVNYIPVKGDVLCMAGSLPGSGGYGHVAVVLWANTTHVSVIEQNGGTGLPAKEKTYAWSFLSAHTQGWLRPKNVANNIGDTIAFDNLSPVVAGEVFYARIKSLRDGTYLTDENHVYARALNKNNPGQVWRFVLHTQSSKIDYSIINAKTQLFLDVDMASKANGTIVKTCTDTKSSAQWWVLKGTANNFIGTARCTKMVLDVNFDNNNKMAMNYYHGGNNQRFALEKLPTPTLSTKNVTVGVPVNFIWDNSGEPYFYRLTITKDGKTVSTQTTNGANNLSVNLPQGNYKASFVFSKTSNFLDSFNGNSVNFTVNPAPIVPTEPITPPTPVLSLKSGNINTPVSFVWSAQTAQYFYKLTIIKDGQIVATQVAKNNDPIYLRLPYGNYQANYIYSNNSDFSNPNNGPSTDFVVLSNWRMNAGYAARILYQKRYGKSTSTTKALNWAIRNKYFSRRTRAKTLLSQTTCLSLINKFAGKNGYQTIQNRPYLNYWEHFNITVNSLIKR